MIEARIERALPRVALALFVAWVFLGNLTQLTNNDIWLQMKVGADVLRDHAVPTVDVYSAVSAGRSFVAHEWLSSILFFLVDSSFGGAGLSVLQALVGVACAALLHFSLPQNLRKSVVTLPLLTCSMYLVSARLTLRPHVFSLLAVAALVLALERWRRSGKVRDLLWLCPVQVVWANLHGEAIVAPALLAALALLTFVIALSPRLQEEAARPLRRADAAQLALVAAGTLACTLLNPRGARLIAFSLGMGADSDFIKRYVFEWTPTLELRAWGHPFTWIYVVELSLLWASLVPRLRQKPFFDLFLALVATGFSLSAKRLVPYLAILGLPILVRSIAAWLGSRREDPVWRRRPGLEALLGASLATVAVTHGLPYLRGADGLRTSLGWAPTIALGELAEVKREGLKGVVFNEYVDGAVVIHELYPDVMPVMDSRIDIYGRELYEEYLGASSSPERFADYMRKYRVNLVMLSNGRRGIYEWLERSGKWRLVLKNERRFVFVARAALPPSPAP